MHESDLNQSNGINLRAKNKINGSSQKKKKDLRMPKKENIGEDLSFTEIYAWGSKHYNSIYSYIR
jgi:hypothetical protein